MAGSHSFASANFIMQFSKYFLALVLSAILAKATEHSTKETASKASAVAHSQETPRTTLKYDDYQHGYGDKEYDSTKTTKEDDDKDKTTTHRYIYEDHGSTKASHGNKIPFMTQISQDRTFVDCD